MSNADLWGAGKLWFGIILNGSVSLAAWRSKSEGALDGKAPATRLMAQDSRFGTRFGKAFRADPNFRPANVNDPHVTVSGRAEPVADA